MLPKQQSVGAAAVPNWQEQVGYDLGTTSGAGQGPRSQAQPGAETTPSKARLWMWKQVI